MDTMTAYVLLAILCLHLCCPLALKTVNMVPMGSRNRHHDSMIDISYDWEVLGPFQIGTRGKFYALTFSETMSDQPQRLPGELTH